MEQKHGANETVTQFLNDVSEQIQYKPIRKQIEEELSEHLEDRKEEYVNQGLDEKKSWKKAVEQMGDAVEIGVRLNQVRKVRKNIPIIGLLVLSIMIGILGNVREMQVEGKQFNLSDFYYFVWGIAVFAFVYLYGYQNLVKHVKKYIGIIVGVWLLYFLVHLVDRKFSLPYFPLRFLPGESIIFAFILLSIPIVFVMSYFRRGKRYEPFLICTGFTLLNVFVSSRFIFEDYFMEANIIYLGTVYTTLLIMAVSGLLGSDKLKKIVYWMISVIIAILIFSFSVWGQWGETWKQFVHPEKVVEGYFDKSYDSLLAKELLRKAKKSGTIQLSQDELENYFTAKWYFINPSEFDQQYKRQELKRITDSGRSLLLEDILPEHYQNNFRITYWILKYGWYPALILIGIVFITYSLLMWQVFKINNKMGRILAFSCILAIALQFVFYLLGNFGYQLGWFCDFPFISEGVCSITLNMVLAGLACSAYRYDKVIMDEVWEEIPKSLLE